MISIDRYYAEVLRPYRGEMSLGTAVVLASDYDACASRLHEVAEICAIAEQERDALRTQVEVMRVALNEMVDSCGSLEYEAGYMDAAKRMAEDVLEALQAKP